MTFADGEQEIRLVLVVSVLCATQWLCRRSRGGCGHISERITPALQACIKLVFKFVATLKIPITRSTSWGNSRSSLSTLIYLRWPFSAAFAPLYYLTSPRNIRGLFASVSSLSQHASCSLSWLHKNNKSLGLQRCECVHVSVSTQVQGEIGANLSYIEQYQ